MQSDPLAELKHRLLVRGLDACERDPARYRSVVEGLRRGDDPQRLRALLDQALEGRPTIEGTVAAAEEAERLLGGHVTSEEQARLRALHESVLARQTGPSVLKSALYEIARRTDQRSLVEATFFDELFDRVETRRMADIDNDVSA